MGWTIGLSIGPAETQISDVTAGIRHWRRLGLHHNDQQVIYK